MGHLGPRAVLIKALSLAPGSCDTSGRTGSESQNTFWRTNETADGGFHPGDALPSAGLGLLEIGDIGGQQLRRTSGEHAGERRVDRVQRTADYLDDYQCRPRGFGKCDLFGRSG